MPEDIEQWAYLVLGVWGVLFVTGLGMRTVDWLLSWSKKK